MMKNSYDISIRTYSKLMKGGAILVAQVIMTTLPALENSKSMIQNRASSSFNRYSKLVRSRGRLFSLLKLISLIIRRLMLIMRRRRRKRRLVFLKIYHRHLTSSNKRINQDKKVKQSFNLSSKPSLILFFLLYQQFSINRPSIINISLNINISSVSNNRLREQYLAVAVGVMMIKRIKITTIIQYCSQSCHKKTTRN